MLLVAWRLFGLLSGLLLFGDKVEPQALGPKQEEYDENWCCKPCKFRLIISQSFSDLQASAILQKAQFLFLKDQLAP